MTAGRILSLLLGAALAGGSLAADWEVTLSVTEPAGIPRKQEPISGGIPVPKGLFKKDQAFALFRKADGAEIPCQVTPLVVETNGTLRWVLVDFQDDIATNTTAQYALRARAPAAKPPATLRVDDGADALTVDTGVIKFAVDKKAPFSLFNAVSVGGKSVVSGGEVYYEQARVTEGETNETLWAVQKLPAGPPAAVKVWYSGPLRVTIEVGGFFQDDPFKAQYKTWITAWAGSSRVWVKHTLCNSNPDQYCRIPVNRSAVRLRLAAADGTILAGAGQPQAIRAGGDAVAVHAGLANAVKGSARLLKGSDVLWASSAGQTNPPAGWIAAKGASTVYACDRLFTSNPARRLAAGRDGLVLEGIAEKFQDAPRDWRGRPTGEPWAARHCWLYDCTHHSSEYLLDFAAPDREADLDALARLANGRLWATAPPEHLADCEALGAGRFGSLGDEIACYEKWGWAFTDKQRRVAMKAPVPGAFQLHADNHGESQCDPAQALLLMYLRTGQRGWFDEAEGWARQHTDLHAWRTDGWAWKDGAIGFASAAPPGIRPVRRDWAPAIRPLYKDSPIQLDLGAQAESKSCSCHLHGSGLADWYCLTGDRDALDAALDNVEQKDDEARRSFQYKPGTSTVGGIREFGRGFEVAMRVLMADPGNPLVEGLCHLYAQVCWQSPRLDERGVHLGGMPGTSVVRNWEDELKARGLKLEKKSEWWGAGIAGVTDTNAQKRWTPKDMGGTWVHASVQNGADLYARHFDDDNMRDFSTAFAQMSARFMRSGKCNQTWPACAFDVAEYGNVHDPWIVQHAAMTNGIGCTHSGLYTRFFSDVCARGYSWTGRRDLLEEGKTFWYHGSKRAEDSKKMTGKPDEIGRFARPVPPGYDGVIEAARLFYEWNHARTDAEPPKAITDLHVTVAGETATVTFTAPADPGGGRVAKYQVKCSELPILPYEEWSYARDLGRKRNWWRAANLAGEPVPGEPGKAERFAVKGVPEKVRFFAVRSYDDSWNLSPLSNVAEAERTQP